MYPADMRGMRKNTAAPLIRIMQHQRRSDAHQAKARWRCSCGSLECRA